MLLKNFQVYSHYATKYWLKLFFWNYSVDLKTPEEAFPRCCVAERPPERGDLAGEGTQAAAVLRGRRRGECCAESQRDGDGDPSGGCTWRTLEPKCVRRTRRTSDWSYKYGCFCELQLKTRRASCPFPACTSRTSRSQECILLEEWF